ncbi:MAG: hypothetical protein NC409_12405 [Clostridium sp.]|nr:hypothetical protein [Clostridium sp.]
MIDLTNISYRVVVIDESGHRYNIENFIQDLGWEENENEISTRFSFTARNDDTSRGYLSGIIKPGCLIGIFASGGAMDEEVARGYVETWNTIQSSSGDTLRCIGYDDLYKLQKSQDNRYYPSGTSTRFAIESIMKDWEIPCGEYKGPDVAHGKMVYRNDYLSDILTGLLDDAEKKGSVRHLIRASKGMVEILPRGSNTQVYVFGEDNTKILNESVSTENLITRVKVIGQADDEEKRSVEAVLNGDTVYGIRQRIYIRGTDETLADAKSAAQDILATDGKAAKEMSVQGLDVPFVRKGDLVYVESGSLPGYYYVNSIQHDADTYSMTMSLELMEREEQDATDDTGSVKKEYGVGDIVTFHGGTHYISSYSGSKGYPAKAGQAKITIKNSSGAHPWHLIHADSGGNVYGWVDHGTFD